MFDGMNRVPAAAFVALVALAASACGSGHRTSGPPPSGSDVSTRTVSSSRLIVHGAVRCTAAVSTPVAVGQTLRVAFSFHNVSHRAVKVPLGYGSSWLVVKGSTGTTYDTRVPLREMLGPYIAPTPIQPGATKTVPFRYLRSRWSGPLRITPGCERTALPPLHVGVTTPGPPPDERTAVADVVTATGHLLDHCRPQAAGVAVTGQIVAPKHSAPPMRARCSVSLQRERGFFVAQVLVLAPPSLRGFRVRGPYEQLGSFRTVGGRDATAIGWEFVVTRDGATSVDSTSAESTKPGNRMAPDWQWTTSGWKGQPGGSRCGGTGGGGGGYTGPLVEFVSVCPS